MSPLTVGLLALAVPACEPPRPPLALANGLPSHAACVRLCAAAEKHYQTQALYFGGYSGDGCHRHTREAWDWWCVWDWAAKATDPRNTRIGRRAALDSLVNQCGWRALVTGQFPVPQLLAGVMDEEKVGGN